MCFDHVATDRVAVDRKGRRDLLFAQELRAKHTLVYSSVYLLCSDTFLYILVDLIHSYTFLHVLICSYMFLPSRVV